MGNSHAAKRVAGDADLQKTLSKDIHKWNLINGEYDATDETPDEHAEFVRSVREFHCQLLMQFEPRFDSCISLGANSGNEGEEEDDEVDMARAWTSWRIAESDDYIAKFAQPYPARPMWASLPHTRSTGAGEQFLPIRPTTWPSDWTGAPLVCVVLRDAPELLPQIERALVELAGHDVGLFVSTRVVKDPDLRFVLVGLRPPSASMMNDSLTIPSGASVSVTQGVSDGYQTIAEQRQMVWAVVHEVVEQFEGDKPDLVVDVYMLRSVYLYDRLFRWLGRTKTINGPLRLLTQPELDLIAHEFGEETASHFLFVCQYLRHLRVAAWASLCCLVVSFLSSQGFLGDKAGAENLKRCFLVWFLPTWGFHLIASWRSTASRAGFRWLGSLGSVQNSVKQVARAQVMESEAEQFARYTRVVLCSVPLLVAQLFVVFTVTVTFVCFEVYIYDVVWELMTPCIRAVALVLYNVAFGVAFVMMIGVFHPVSKAVTRWEHHPDKDVFEWHFTVKIYANWFLAVFVYFFVIAFCYIPFGDNIAEGIANLYPENDATTVSAGGHKYSIHGALQGFRPSLRRLSVDVALFFVLQDSARLMHWLIPVLRAAWGLMKMKGVQQKRHRQKRRAIVKAVFGMFRCKLWHPSKVRDPQESQTTAQEASAEAKARRTQELDTLRRNALLEARNISMSAGLTDAFAEEPGVAVVFVVFESVEIDCPEESTRFMFGEGINEAGDTVILSCSLDLPNCAGDAPTVSAHARHCAAQRGRKILREEAEDTMPDVMTLTVHPRVLAAQAAARHGPVAPQGDPRARATARAAPREGSDSSDSESSTSGEETATIDQDGFCACNAKAMAPGRSSAYISRDFLKGLGGLDAVRVRVGAEVLSACRRPGQGPVTFDQPFDVPLRHGTVESGEVRMGPVRARYVAGLVHGWTHCEALDKIPIAVRAARNAAKAQSEGMDNRMSSMTGASSAAGMDNRFSMSMTAGSSTGSAEFALEQGFMPSVKMAAEEEAHAWEDVSIPYLWWDEELSSRYWEEVFELFAAKETFETFELYAHLATQFSYVCLFGIAVPVCPLLAWLFTSLEMRQDQLRLLWLSRPPHPGEETKRFKRTVTIDAWYTIIRFTCYLSVVVNLLLWGITYSGLSSTQPVNWSTCEWWRAIAIFLTCQQVCFALAGVFHRGIARLDHDTAAAYLRRCSRLQHSVLRVEDDDSATLTRRQADRYRKRRRLTKSPSRGLSSII